MTIHEIRQKYLDYMKKLDHAIIPSASLIPENDPTTLFTGSGMQPMVEYLLGQPHPLGNRIADSQKCFRAQDIEEIGDSRHTTFFEMLGNWSLGDYFKTEQITWMFNFLIKEIGLDPEKFYITVYRGNDEIGIPQDNESVKLWQELFASVGVDAQVADNAEELGLQGARIFYYDDKKNWWSRAGVPSNMPVGEPGGPDTEMFYDFGDEAGEYEEEVMHVNSDNGRFIEIGNNVFMQYQRTENGFEQMAQKNVDFGGGLERIACAANNTADIFLLDVFDGMRATVERLSGKAYDESFEVKRAYRVILDHMRAATFLIGDGAIPSNKEQGYFTRRLIRRAIRFARDLGVTVLFASELSRAVIAEYKHVYTNLAEKEDWIIAEVQKEEEKFQKALDKGIREFDKILKGFEIAKERTGKIITELAPKHVFKLYDTYGFPYEMTEELATEHNLTVDRAAFDKLVEEHQAKSRAGAEQKFKGGLADTGEMSVKLHTATHLLHQALRTVLGDHVEQRGSNITPKRLRFDFTHGEKMTPEQKQQVEDMVNEQIKRGLAISCHESTVEEAKEEGAIGLFEDKYAEKVNVYTMGDFSKEICGGPHVENTSELGWFKIKKEESSSAGIRRIKAIVDGCE